MAYSEDYGKAAVAYKDAGHTYAELKEVFGITNKTYSDWKKLYTETGSYCKRKVTRKPKKINLERLKKALEEKPDTYLYELAELFECSEQAVFYALKKLKITYKKILHIHRKIRSETLSVLSRSRAYSTRQTCICGRKRY